MPPRSLWFFLQSVRNDNKNFPNITKSKLLRYEKIIFRATDFIASTMTVRRMVFINGSNASTFLELFNFSLEDAAFILEQHLSQDHVFDHTTEESIISCYVLLIITGVCSNVVVSGIIVKNNRIRSPRNLYVVNLSISDLTLCLFCMPFTLLALVRRSWPLGALLCKLVPFVQGSTVYVSSATVSAIAIDRHKTIINVFPKVRKKNKTRVLSMTLAIWLLSFGLSSPVSVAQSTISVGLPGIYIYEKCIEQWPWSNTKGLYTVLTLLAQFVIPAIVLLVTHFRIESHLNFSIKRHTGSVPRAHQDRVQKELLRNRRATMVLLLISVVFTLTWMPWNIVNLVADFYPECMSPQSLYLAFAICHMIAMTSATSNPILYGWLNANIRRELLRVGEKMSSALLSHRSTTNLANNSDNQPGNYDNMCMGQSIAEIENCRIPVVSKSKL